MLAFLVVAKPGFLRRVVGWGAEALGQSQNPTGFTPPLSVGILPPLCVGLLTPHCLRPPLCAGLLTPHCRRPPLCAGLPTPHCLRPQVSPRHASRRRTGDLRSTGVAGSGDRPQLHGDRPQQHGDRPQLQGDQPLLRRLHHSESDAYYKRKSTAIRLAPRPLTSYRTVVS